MIARVEAAEKSKVTTSIKQAGISPEKVTTTKSP